MMAVAVPQAQTAKGQKIRLEVVRRFSRDDPAVFLNELRCLDTESGEEFRFHLDDPESGWYWQKEVLDTWLSSTKSVVLKARQLGITWLASGLACWHLVNRPGTRVLAVSINEAEASKLVRRVWTQLHSLPRSMWNGIEIVKPTRSEPSTVIEVRHPDGRLSTVLGLPSTPKAGHGETAALVILDEFSRQEYAAETWKAVLPTASKGGHIVVISTGNGVSAGPEKGNYFHYVYSNADALGIARKFLRWDLHPERDDDWYRREAMALPERDRGEQYPRDDIEAFILTGDPFFDTDSLQWYRENAVRDELFRADFVEAKPNQAKLVKRKDGRIRVFLKPAKERRYAVGADVATGKGQDFSAAVVVDLSTMGVVAEYHGKVEPAIYAEQLHYLGRWYNDARLAIETGGGYGEAPIVFLRDGKDGRPPYRMLYRHRQFSRGDVPEHKPYGFPMTTHTRPLVLGYLQKALRERAIPNLSGGALAELSTFVHRDTNPSPRAQEGCNDDRVMSLAVAMEMFRQYGEHPDQWRSEHKGGFKRPYPWQGKKTGRDVISERYGQHVQV